MENKNVTINETVSSTALVITFIGVFLFAAKAIFVKLGYDEGMNANTMLLLRMGFSFPVYLVILFWGQGIKTLRSLPLHIHIHIWFLGLLGYYMSSWLDFAGLQYISANLERLVVFAYPTLVVIISYFVNRKPITKEQFVAIGVTYGGICITFADAFEEPFTLKTWMGIGLVFGSALTYAFYLVGSTDIIKRTSVSTFTAYSMVVSTIVIFIHCSFAPIVPLGEIPGKVYYYGLAMALFTTIIPSFMISHALRQIGASRMAIVGSVGPVCTIVLSYMVLGETLTFYQALGGAIILIGVTWVNYKK